MVGQVGTPGWTATLAQGNATPNATFTANLVGQLGARGQLLRQLLAGKAPPRQVWHADCGIPQVAIGEPKGEVWLVGGDEGNERLGGAGGGVGLLAGVGRGLGERAIRANMCC